MECLKELEELCPTPDDYRLLCALLTLPRLSDHTDFKNWNPSSARVECFAKVLTYLKLNLSSLQIHPIIAPFLPSTSNKAEAPCASNDRLVQLLAKGLFYEGCVDYCQAQAIGDKSEQIH